MKDKILAFMELAAWMERQEIMEISKESDQF